MIEIRDLTKNYGARTAIRNLNFTLKKGEVVGFLGPNGAGKTTTMKILTGFMAPTSGVVKIAGFDVFENPLEVKKRIGYLPEIPPVYGDMTVQSFLKFVSELKGLEKNKIKDHVEEALQKTLLQDVRGRLIQNLSKGFRQRVGIAQALLGRPEVLILDEPTVGLDPRQVAEIRDLLIQLRGNHTVILSTHILPEVEATCDRVIIINQGQIVGERSLVTKSKRLRLKVRQESASLPADLERIPGITGVEKKGQYYFLSGTGDDSLNENVAEFIVSSRAGLVELAEAAGELESTFINLTNKNRGSES